MHRLQAPFEGTIIEIPIRQGEVAAAGTTLITIADLNRLTLIVYVPENRVGQIAVGMPVSVSADSFPGRRFDGIVGSIADQAEFTPRNVATQEERVNLVFAVQIKLSNLDGLLKPGMPATARFEANVGEDNDW
jgi:HlyD family secretion protein